MICSCEYFARCAWWLLYKGFLKGRRGQEGLEKIYKWTGMQPLRALRPEDSFKKYERKINSALDRGLACPIYSSALLTDDLRCGTCGGNEAS